MNVKENHVLNILTVPILLVASCVPVGLVMLILAWVVRVSVYQFQIRNRSVASS